MRLNISDNGRPAAEDRAGRSGNGLSGLRERVSAAGGRLVAGPTGNGIDAAQELRTAVPGCAVVIVTTFGRPGYLRRAMQGGGRGFLVKDGPVEGLADHHPRWQATAQVSDQPHSSSPTGRITAVDVPYDNERVAELGATFLV